MHQQSLTCMALVLILAAGCNTGEGEEDLSTTSPQALTACPTSTSTNAVDHAAASAALEVAAEAPLDDWITEFGAWSSQFFRLNSAGTGIEYDPSHPRYSAITSGQKAALAFAQTESAVGTYLRGGLSRCYSTTNGKSWLYVDNLSGVSRNEFGYNKTSTATIWRDRAYYRTVTEQVTSWCKTSLHRLTATSKDDPYFMLLSGESASGYNMTSARAASYTGSSNRPCTPFNGPNGSNPYLFVSQNGQTANLESDSAFEVLNCKNVVGGCRKSYEIDPAPYGDWGTYYNSSGLQGTQSNPFDIWDYELYAVSDHQNEYARRSVNGQLVLGKFSTAVTVSGTTKYKWKAL
jgi:hypothetical protein